MVEVTLGYAPETRHSTNLQVYTCLIKLIDWKLLQVRFYFSSPAHYPIPLTKQLDLLEVIIIVIIIIKDFTATGYS